VEALTWVHRLDELIEVLEGGFVERDRRAAVAGEG
jgi:hypothetical protein